MKTRLDTELASARIHTTSGLIAVVTIFFLMPVGQLYVLLLERRLGAIQRQGYSVLAIQRRWYNAVMGGVTAVIGLVLHLSTTTTVEIRFAGTILLVWGLLCIWVAILAFRAKPWLADARRLIALIDGQ